MEETYVDCEACLTKVPRKSPLRRIRRLTDQGEVNGWPNLTASTEYKHFVDAGGLLARYDLPSLTHCSLGTHWHNHGWIVEARCGLILKLGWKCAGNSVHGYAEMMAHYSDSESFFTRLAEVRTRPAECLALLEVYLPDIRRYAEFQAAKRHTTFGAVVMRMATANDPRAAVVPMPFKRLNPKTGEYKLDYDYRPVARTDFFLKNFDSEAAGRVLNEAKALVDETRELTERTAPEVVDAFYRRCTALNRQTKELGNLVSCGWEFTRTENLGLIGIAVSKAS